MPLRFAKRPPRKGEKLSLVVEDTGRVTCAGKSVQLTHQQAKLLVHLGDRTPRVCTPEQLLVAIRPPSRHDEMINLDHPKVLISKVRKSLQLLTDLEVIETVRSVGYRVPNYVEIMTDIESGEKVRIDSDQFAGLVHLSFISNSNIDTILERVITAGGKIVEAEIMKDIKETDGGAGEIDAWD